MQMHLPCLQWRSEAKCHLGQTTGVPSFPASNLGTRNARGSRFVFIKDVTNNKASWTSQSSTYKLKGVLFFILDYGSWFFCLSPLPSLHVHLWTRHISVKTIFPVVFQAAVSLTT